MRTPPLGVLAFLVALPLFADPGDDHFTCLDLTPSANFKINFVAHSPTGRVEFKGVPFELPESKQVLQTEGVRAPGPASFHIPAEVARPRAVYILLQGCFVKPQFKGRKVGEIVVEFKGGKKSTYPITAWETLRETWSYNTQIVQPKATATARLVNVYAEPEYRAGKPSTGFLDMYVIEFERGAMTEDLEAIEINDLSKELLHDVAPALIVSGITVKHD